MEKLNESVKGKVLDMKRLAVIITLLGTLAISGCLPSEEDESKPKMPEAGKVEIKSQSGPAIEIMGTEIDLGTIRSEQQKIVGEIIFLNVGNRALQVRKVSSPSPCFLGYSGDRLVLPGQGGVLKVEFDASKVETSDVRDVINIETNDAGKRTAEVYFKFHVVRGPGDEQTRMLRAELSSIREELRALRKDMAKVLAAVEAGKQKPKRQPDTTIYEVAIGSSAVLGPKDAPVTIVEFADFQCPYCVREYPKIKQIVEEHGGKVRVVFKHFPLRFHTKAKPAHAAAELARLQGGAELFWKMHDLIMAEPKKLAISDLREHAKSLNLDLAKFDEVTADEGKMNALFAADMAEARKCKVRGTPTVFINGLKLTNRSIKGYKARIDQILAGEKGAGTAGPG